MIFQSKSYASEEIDKESPIVESKVVDNYLLKNNKDVSEKSDMDRLYEIILDNF